MKTLDDIVKAELKSEPELSFDRSDIERRILFPAGRFTSPGPLLAPLGAAIMTVAFYGLLSIVPQSRFTDMFTQRSAVPYVIVFLTGWSVMMLLIKNAKVGLQRKALAINPLPTDEPGFIVTVASAEQVLENLYQKVDDPKHFLLTRRIHTALGNLRNMG
ncbi:unnamed protein product, partial [marine sediment metagenome]